MTELLQAVKLALRLTVDAYDDELTDLIEAAKLDLGVAGVDLPGGIDALVKRAIVTYCKVHFGGSADADYVRLKESYDEQKAQLSMNSNYTFFPRL